MSKSQCRRYRGYVHEEKRTKADLIFLFRVMAFHNFLYLTQVIMWRMGRSMCTCCSFVCEASLSADQVYALPGVARGQTPMFSLNSPAAAKMGRFALAPPRQTSQSRKHKTLIFEALHMCSLHFLCTFSISTLHCLRASWTRVASDTSIAMRRQLLQLLEYNTPQHTPIHDKFKLLTQI